MKYWKLPEIASLVRRPLRLHHLFKVQRVPRFLSRFSLIPRVLIVESVEPAISFTYRFLYFKADDVQLTLFKYEALQNTLVGKEIERPP